MNGTTSPIFLDTSSQKTAKSQKGRKLVYSRELKLREKVTGLCGLKDKQTCDSADQLKKDVGRKETEEAGKRLLTLETTTSGRKNHGWLKSKMNL